MVEALRLANAFLLAVMPETHERINERLGLAISRSGKVILFGITGLRGAG